MKLLSFAALAVTALALVAVKAEAQTVDSTSNAGSNANSGSSSDSSSRSKSSGNQQRQGQSVTLNQNSTTPANTTGTFNSTGTQTNNNNSTSRETVSGGTNNSNVSSGYTSSDNIVRTTPTVYAPPVSGGNPCTLAVSGGVSVIGWGAAAGGTFVDQDCADRQKIAMIHNAGYQQAARELMCNDKATYLAFRGSQTPCAPRPAFDGTPAAGAPAPAVQPAPVPLGAPQRVSTTQPFQPAGRLVCLNTAGREVAAGAPGASCGYI